MLIGSIQFDSESLKSFNDHDIELINDLTDAYVLSLDFRRKLEVQDSSYNKGLTKFANLFFREQMYLPIEEKEKSNYLKDVSVGLFNLRKILSQSHLGKNFEDPQKYLEMIDSGVTNYSLLG